MIKSIILIFSMLNVLSYVDKGFSLEDIKKKKEINIVVKNSATSYYIDRDGNKAGIDYELGKIIAQRLGVLPNFIVKDSVHDIMISLRGGEADFALAGLSKTEKRAKDFLITKHYQSIRQQLVCHKKFNIKSLSRLHKVNILVARSSSYVQTLNELQKKYPKISFKQSSILSSEEILEEVWKGKIDCTIADSNIVAITLRSFPELRLQKSFKYEGLVGILPKSHSDIHYKINKIITKLLKNGEMSNLEHKYYDHFDDFDYYDLKVFKKRIKRRLPKYKKLFKSAAKKYDLDWKLLAAISYQESHWNHKAKSPTGVRGLMMLTNATAKQMGVKNRVNPKESIFGGAKYIKKLILRQPKYLKDSDRIFMALASYNVGFYHVRDARSLTIWQNKNPNKWKDVSETLPLLSKKKYYRKLPYGYARGHEPVIYVNRIREYYELLKNE